MLYFDRIDISEDNHVNKISVSKEWHTYYYWYFLNYSFKFQTNVCIRWHDLLMMFMNLNNIAILNIKGFGYHCIIGLISKNEDINLIQNADLTKKAEHYKT